MKNLKILVEKHPDGYVAYPLGLKGVVVGQGETYEEALSDVKSAFAFTLKVSEGPCWRLSRQYWRHSSQKRELKFDVKVPC
jgi:predicted RNase H-like HicB family nuclease